MSTPVLAPPAAPSRPAASGARHAAWTIALRELTDHLVSARFLVIALLVVGLTPLAVYVGARDYHVRLAEYGRLTAERQERVGGPAGEQVRGMDSGDERIMLRAMRAPEPLSVLVRGLDGALPQYWEFTSVGVEAGPSAASTQRLADVLGQLDMEFLVRIVLGLLAILLAFDAVAGEKEMGTLRAVLSHSVPRPAFMAGKVIGGAVTLLVPLAAAFLLALLSARFFGVDLLAPDTLSRAALLAAASALYLMCLYSLGLMVSSVVTAQKTALVVLLVAWVAMVLAIPPTSTLVAQAVSPVPAPYLVATQKRALDADLRRTAELAMGEAYMRVAGQTEVTMSGRIYEENRAAMDRAFTPIMTDYFSQRRRALGEVDRDAERRAAVQARVARAIMSLSPAAAFASAAADLAGTGDADYRAWREAVRRQQTRLDAALFEDPPTLRIQATECCSMTTDLRVPPPVASLPAFAPPQRDAGAAVGRSLGALGLLLLYTALFVAGGFVAFGRYDVR
ncbi:MAG TPA: ABC transporter permease [Longimicrobiaceae bacterium]|nr:ABC transporter permease [Longimicrobiaceae bacterium]